MAWVLRSRMRGGRKDAVHLQNVFCSLAYVTFSLLSLYGGRFFLGLTVLAFRILSCEPPFLTVTSEWRSTCDIISSSSPYDEQCPQTSQEVI
ncbi:hypothetical protein VULLAG_LOCUS22532 [Vulpes lagopus]